MTNQMDRLPWFVHLADRVAEVRTLCESVSRQLYGWAESLQNSEIKGQRYLTEEVKESQERRKRADFFIANLREIQGRAAEERSKGRGSEIL